ncbi:hypothetical protein ACVCNR_16760 [Aquamicrobium terrae]
MVDSTEEMSGAEMEQIKIIFNTLYLCIGYALRHVENREGAEAASDLKNNMLESLKSGDINMALLEETKTFDLVVSKIEELTWADA